MKSIGILVAFFVSILLMEACNKNNSTKVDYLIFGEFHGECVGEKCIEIFRLEDQRLLEDSKDEYPKFNQFYKGDFHEVSNLKFEKVKDLNDVFPDSLLNINEKIIGEPDAGDWGGFYIEYNRNGIRKYWILDKKQDNVPDNLHHFIDVLSDKIDLISD